MSAIDTAAVLLTSEVMAILKVKKPDDIYALGKAGRIQSVRLKRQHRWTKESVEKLLRGEDRPTPRRHRTRASSSPGPSKAELAKLSQVPDHFG